MTLITFSPDAVERNIHDKLREAALRRADREKKLMERLKRQTSKKLDHQLELLDTCMLQLSHVHVTCNYFSMLE